MAETKQYYEEELRYLTEAGREFGEAFPEIANYLNLNAVEDRDPYVERLFEGFAFLTGRIREKLDDGFPEFTHHLMDIIAPEFLKAVPSLAMLEFSSRPMMQQSYKVNRGTEVLSNPVGEDLTVCRFRTTRAVTVHPMNLAKVEQVSHPSKGSGLAFSFDVTGGLNFGKDGEPSLPVFLHGDRSLAWNLHHLFTRQTAEITVQSPQGTEHFSTADGEPLIYSGGFEEDAYLLPVPANGLEYGRVLQEYFLFEEKFRYIQFASRLFSLVPETGDFSITVYFQHGSNPGNRVTGENFKLYASPVINLFEHQAEPINLDHSQFEYRVKPKAGEQWEIFDILEVNGVDKVTARTRPYHRFSEFRHEVCRDGNRPRGSYYTMSRQNAGRDGQLCTISLGLEGLVEHLQEEYLSLKLLSTNGSLPRKEILENDICSPVAGFPDFLGLSNFTRPSAPVPPPRSQYFLWSILSHMSMNFRTLCRKDVLQEVLSLYDWSGKGANRKLIQGILGVSKEKKGYMIKGQLVHGTEIAIKFKDGTFGVEGEQQMFGKVLLQFFSNYASINHVVSLSFVSEPSGAIVQWEPEWGLCHTV